MEKLLHFLAFFGIYAAVLIAVVPWLRKSVTARLLFSIVWGLYLTLQVVFFQTMLPLRFGEELSSLSWGSSLIEAVHGSRSRAVQFADSSCTLIDVAYDQELVPEPQYGDSTLRHAITDRRKLTALLRHLADHTDLFDVVVLDVFFQDATDSDVPLFTELGRLERQRKLALAYDPVLCTNKTIYDNRDLAAAYGGVTEERVEDLYFQHTLFAPPLPGQAALRYSLPYRAYMLIDTVERLEHVNHTIGYAREHTASSSGWITAGYAPMFLMGTRESENAGTRVNIALGGEAEPSSVEGAHVEHLAGPSPALLMGHVVEEIAADPAGAFFNEELALHNRISAHHVVFIGNFNDAERDLHHTVQGPMHGALMSVNIIHELLEHHHQGLWQLVASLWLVLSLLTFMLVARCLHDQASHPPKSNPALDLLSRIWHSLVVEERHYWLLFALLLLLQVWFHRVVNIMSFVLLFGIMEFIFRSWLPVRIKALE